MVFILLTLNVSFDIKKMAVELNHIYTKVIMAHTIELKKKIYIFLKTFLKKYMEFQADVADADKAEAEAEEEISCTNIFPKDGFESFIGEIKESHESLDEIIALLLGFYVEVIMSRWWDQVTLLPKIENVAISASCLVSNGKDKKYQKIYQKIYQKYIKKYIKNIKKYQKYQKYLKI
jgi:hypothetical protein